MIPSPKIDVLLVDDHAMVRQGLTMLLNAQPDMHVVETAGDGRSAVSKAEQCRPDIVVMDVAIPRLSGASATTEIVRANPQIRVIALSMFEDRNYLRELMEAGASGYVVKRSAASELVCAIRVVSTGGVYIDPVLAAKVVSSFVGSPSHRRDSRNVTLSDREEEVLRMIAQGYSNKEIASRLCLSVKTIETYKTRSTEKLLLNSRVDIIRFARDRGWLEDL